MTSRFAAPTRLGDALALLAADPAARPVAGGTDLVVAARQGRRTLPEAIVAVDRVEELAGAGVGSDDGALVLGALTTHAWLAGSPDVRSRWSALADAAAIIGSPATRAMGTIGGNLMNASPAADTTGPLVVLDAVASLRSADGGARVVPVSALAAGPGRTVATATELLTHVHVPGGGPGSGSAYIRLEFRRAMEIAVVGAAVWVTIAGDGTIAAARVALTAVAPTVIRSPGAEAALAGARASIDAGEAGRAAGAAAPRDAAPIDDVRASADYRRAMLDVVVRRTVAAAIARARGEDIPVPASRWAFGQES